jgi:cytochrome P450
MTVLEFPAANFTHNDFEYIPDPFSFFDWMREHQPAYMSDRIFGGAWLFFRYADCLDLMKTEQLSNARAAVPLRFLPPGQQEEFSDMIGLFERWLAFHDGSQHTQSRHQANSSYMPFTDALLEPRIQGFVDDLLDKADLSNFDLMSEFAFPLPAMVIADVLGVPTEAHPELTRWTDDIAHLFGSTQVTLEHLHRTRVSTRELAEFLASPECTASAAREHGLLHTMRTTEIHGYRFSDQDVVAQAALMLFAGVASIRYLIGNCVTAIDRRPRAERELLLRPETQEAAVEELLRFCTPVQFVGRVAQKDFTYTTCDDIEVPIRAGQPVMLYVGSANRDPDEFDRADELVLSRPLPNTHLTFGAGRHLCFGDPLVRQTTRIALAELYRRMPGLQVMSDTLDWNNNLGFHGPTALRVSRGDT